MPNNTLENLEQFLWFHLQLSVHMIWAKTLNHKLCRSGVHECVCQHLRDELWLWPFFLFIIVTFYEQKDWLFTSIQITLHGCLRVRKTRITVLQLCASTSQSSCSFYSKELDVCDGCSLFSWFIWDLALVRMGYARGHRGFDRTRWIHSFLTQSECLRQNVKKFLRGVSLILLVQQ